MPGLIATDGSNHADMRDASAVNTDVRCEKHQITDLRRLMRGESVLEGFPSNEISHPEMREGMGRPIRRRIAPARHSEARLIVPSPCVAA